MNKLIIGRHLSIIAPDYLLGTAQKSFALGANALSFTLGGFRKDSFGSALQLKSNEFRQFLSDNNLSINHVIVHAPFTMNLGNSSNLKIFQMSVDLLTKRIKLMEEIGLSTIVIHAGSSLTSTTRDGLNQLVNGLNLVLDSTSNDVRIALETNHGYKNSLGSNFQQLANVINGVNQKDRVGVCWDTCHLYAAGYDIKNDLEQIVNDFDKLIGLKKLWVIHINDSKRNLGSGVDRHANIGCGLIGLDALRNVVQHPLLNKIPKILETPYKTPEIPLSSEEKWILIEKHWKDEIEILRKVTNSLNFSS